MKVTLLMALYALPMWSGSAMAQQESDAVRLERAAARYAARAVVGYHMIALDTLDSGVRARRSTHPKNHLSHGELARELGAQSYGSERDFYSCTDAMNPRTCTLRNADALIAIFPSVVRRDTGFVFVRTRTLSDDKRQPVSWLEEGLRFIRRGAGWVFDGTFSTTVQ